MKGVYLAAAAIAALAVFAPAGESPGAPARDLTSVANGTPASPVLQWFQHRLAPIVVSSQKEFYDNYGYGDGWHPWGGVASWHAVRGVVTNVVLDPTEAITGFTVRASVTNDLYDYRGDMQGTDGLNDHHQSAKDIVGQKSEAMRNVRLSASFADDGIQGNLPDTPPFRPESNIYGVDYEWLGWFCYYWGELPPYGSYWVPAWELTGSRAVTCSGGTPDVILPGETHSRDLTFACYEPIRIGNPDYDTIMMSYQQGVELFLNRTKSLKVSNYPDMLSTDIGVPFPEYLPVFDSDVSVFYDPEVSTVKWQQPPDPATPENLFYGWNERSDWWNGPIAAADWVCTTNDPVTAVRWWGSFAGWKHNRPPQLPDHFHIQFWTDVPASPFNPFSHPGRVIHEVVVSDYQCRFAGWDYDFRTKSLEACFEFNCSFAENQFFFQDPGPQGANVYWISIAACQGGSGSLPYPWGWKTRPRDSSSQAPDDAVSITQPVQPTLGSEYVSGSPLYWPTPEDSWDLAFELTAQTMLQELKWDQPPIPGQTHGTFIGWDEKSVYRSDQIVADDWLCTDARPVSDIHWWGSYIGWDGLQPPPDAPPMFHLGIWTDVPAGGGTLWSHPGQMIWQAWVGRDQLNEIFVGTDTYPGHPSDSCFRYDFRIPRGEWFYQIPGPIATVYWLSVSAVYDWVTPVHAWGWKTRARSPESPAPDNAVKIFDPTAPNVGDRFRSGAPIIDPLGVSMDAAFQLTAPSYGEAYLKWSQPPRGYYSPGFNGWDEPSVYGREQIVADDWVCLSTKPVTDIHWWGSFQGWSSEELPPRMPDGFHITIWTDVPPNGSGYSHPGEVIWSAFCDNYTCEFAGWDIDPRMDAVPEACFKFEQQLRPDQWFRQESVSKIYWISIAAVYHDGYPQEYLWGWKTRPRMDSLAPDAAVRIFDPTSPWPGSVYVRGEPIYWPPEEDKPWDMAFVLTTLPMTPGSLTFAENIDIPDHFWWPQGPITQRNEMLSFNVQTDESEAVRWESITLTHYGTGDPADVSMVEVWNDVDNNGKWSLGDVYLGSGTYSGGVANITLSVQPVIPPNSTYPALITYVMNPPTSPAGSTFNFEVTAASGTGETSGAPAAIYGLPLPSATKIIGLPPVTIGEAKLAPLGTRVLLEGKVVTADFLNRLDLFYIEEKDRSAGIGVLSAPERPLSDGINIGDRVSVLGTTVLLYGVGPLPGTELAIVPEFVVLAPGEPIRPLGKNNKSSGGGKFGEQPGVFDDASMGPVQPAYGLNDVGSLVRLWGRVTCYNWELMLPWGPSPVFWIDDGSNLRDGFNAAADPCRGVAVLMPAPTFPPSGYLGVTGIMKAVPNPNGVPVRLLVPRTDADMTLYPEPD